MKTLYKCFFCIIFIFIFSNAFCLSNDVFLQSTPIFIGEKNFNLSLNKITENKEPLALVLGGGSARAYAHIGVLRQLEKANIFPDFIVANSMGAVIGLLYASGFSPDDIELLVTEINLTEFFDLVFPTKGGLISTRYFKEVLNRFFPNGNFDIEDSIIPIIITTEDLYTKRQIWFSNGDIANMMTASFAMPFMMEPVEYYINDGEKTFLIDSGTVDLGGIGVAAQFTKNIIISTALYDPNLNFNNPIVNLNRAFSIGKERALIKDYLDLNPYLIRNEVEHFSFMDFSRSNEIIKKGDEAGFVFANENKDNLIFTSSSVFNTNEFLQIREKRSDFVKEVIKNYKRGQFSYSENPSIGVKIRPNIFAIDGPQLFLSEPFSLGVYGFFDYKPIFTRLGAKTDILNNYGFDFFIRLQAKKTFSFQSSLEYLRTFEKDGESLFYNGNVLSCNFYLFNNVYLQPYASLEILSDINFTDSIFLTRFGLPFTNPTSNFFAFNFEPYYFGYLKNNSPLTHGFGVDSYIDFKPFSFFGLKIGEHIRNTPFENGAYIFPSDSYRGSVSKNFKGENPQNFTSISSFELYYYTIQTNFTAFEAFKLEKFKVGAYADLLRQGESFADLVNSQIIDENKIAVVGSFVKSQVSIFGLYIINLDASFGWNFDSNSLNAQINFSKHW